MQLYFSQAGSMDEILQLTLQETYCLPVLTYAVPACYFKECQLTELDACWNMMYHKIFTFNQWESVKCYVLLISFLTICLGHSIDSLNSDQRVSKYLFSYSEIHKFIFPDFNILCGV